MRPHYISRDVSCSSGRSGLLLGGSTTCTAALSATSVSLQDLSASHRPDAPACRASSKQLLDEHAGRPGSWLTVLAVGDESTSNEPKLLARYPIPRE